MLISIDMQVTSIQTKTMSKFLAHDHELLSEPTKGFNQAISRSRGSRIEALNRNITLKHKDIDIETPFTMYNATRLPLNEIFESNNIICISQCHQRVVYPILHFIHIYYKLARMAE